MRHFTPVQLQAYLQSVSDNNSVAPLLLDVREPWEFEHCQLENSILVPMRQVPDYADSGKLKANEETVVICHHGIRSRQVAQYLETVGFTNLINLTGGVAAWAYEVDPNMKRY